MTARVQVVVEAKDQASGILRGLTSQLGSFGSVIEEVTGKSVNWGNVIALATDTVAKGLKESIDATMAYAKEVRDLSLISGSSAEEASRLIQVLDDYEITAQDVTAATRFMTKNGLEPTVETVAQLSDQYLSLNTAQEKNQFILDNLGRGGLQWANVLSQGGDALRALNDGVSQSLILDDKKIKQLEEYRLNLGQLQDNWLAMKVTIGTTVVPAFNNVFELFKEIADAQTAFENEGMTAYEAHRLALMGFTTEAELAADAIEGITEANQTASETVVDMSEHYNTLIGSIMDYQKELDRYEETTLNLQETEAGLMKERDDLMAQLQDLKNRGYGETSRAVQDVAGKIDDVNGRIDQNKKKLSENEEAHRRWAAQTVFSFAQARAAADGSISDMEGKLLVNMGKALGLFDEQTADTMESVNEAFSQLDTSDAESAIAALESSLQALTGQPWVINITTQQTGQLPSSTNYNPYSSSNTYAAGGEVYAGRPVLVGERGSEPFFPASNGRIIGHAEALHAMSLGGGSNYFYGNVTLQVGDDIAGGLLEYR